VTGTLTILSSDAANPSLTVSLTGTGVSATPLSCGYSLGPDIYAKWVALGSEFSVVGCATADETEAALSPQKTTGRMATFKNGVIYWHRDGAFAGRAYEVHGCALGTYNAASASSGVLGFPVSDQIVVDGGFRSDFQGGYIVTVKATNVCSQFAAGTDYTGVWTTDRGSMTLLQDSLNVSGTYRASGTVTGSVSGTTLSLNWSDLSGQGLATFSLASSGAIWIGSYTTEFSAANGPWNGTRAAGGTPGFVTPSLIDFGSATVHTTKTLNLVASASGSGPLTLQQFTSDNPAFVVNIGGFSVPPGGSTIVPIQFTPQIPGQVFGNITISTLDPGKPNIVVKVSGVGQ
jgi:hypothetical protein